MIVQPSPFKHRDRRPATCRQDGFSLVELLVVIGVIVLLMSIIMIVGQGTLTSAKTKEATVLIAQVDEAIDAFRSENPYRRVQEAQERYGPNPPDHLAAYTPDPRFGRTGGIPIDGFLSLMPGGRGTYYNLQSPGILTNHQAIPPPLGYVPNSDIKALVWALRSIPASRALYDSIPDRFKVTIEVDDANTRGEFFDLNENDVFNELVDKEVQYLVDPWGNPLSYYNVRVPEEDNDPVPGTSGAWSNHAATAFNLVQLNKNQPVVMSYGPNGNAQLDADETLELQYSISSGGGPGSGNVLFPSTLNESNVFADESIAERLGEVLE